MQMPQEEMKKLPLAAAVDRVLAGALDRFPPLIVNRCLADAKSILTKYTGSQFVAGHAVQAQTLTMPRRGFGPRPVSMLAAGTHALYDALVDAIKDDLPPPSRSSENWASHNAFGNPGTETASNYVVELDIAACYEYIDHETLRHELIAQTMDVLSAERICQLLREIFERPRGLPQLMATSDVLADTYLSAMERTILRSGYPVSRVADDFKILADHQPDRAQADGVIEEAAEVARAFGFTLSAEKTRIRKAASIQKQMDDSHAFLDKYFQQAEDQLNVFDLFAGPYGDAGVDSASLHDTKVRADLPRKIFEDWYASLADGEHDESSNLAKFAPNALVFLKDDPDRLPDTWLTELVFRHPLRIESVIGYLQHRESERKKTWRRPGSWFS